jgi:hypothetical protein
MNHNSYIAVGHGGDYVCLSGHEGSTPAERGVPVRCLHGGCDKLTERFGDGSRVANAKIKAERLTLAKSKGGIR